MMNRRKFLQDIVGIVSLSSLLKVHAFSGEKLQLTEKDRVELFIVYKEWDKTEKIDPELFLRKQYTKSKSLSSICTNEVCSESMFVVKGYSLTKTEAALLAVIGKYCFI